MDELLEGGFPRGRVILVSGGCGTGKTILATQFLYNGIVKYGEPGVLVTLEQHPKRIREEMKVMGFDLEPLEKDNLLAIVDASLSDIVFKESGTPFTLSPSASFGMETITGIIQDAAEKIGAKRAVVDSFSALDTLVETRHQHSAGSSPEDSRKAVLGINYKFQSMGLTSILIADILEGGGTSRHGMEEFIADGVLSLNFNVSGPDAGRHLVIKKMRGTRHSENIHTIEFIRGEGIRVKAF